MIMLVKRISASFFIKQCNCISELKLALQYFSQRLCDLAVKQELQNNNIAPMELVGFLAYSLLP